MSVMIFSITKIKFLPMLSELIFTR